MRALNRPGEAAGSWAFWVSTVILAAGAVVLGSAFLYSALNHEYYSGAPRVMRFFLYAVAPLTAVSLAVSLWLLTTHARIRLALLLTSIFIGSYAAEAGAVFLRILATWREPVAIAGDFRSKRQVVKALRDEGKRAFPDFRAEVFLRIGSDGRARSVLEIDGREVLPLGGTSKTTTIMCNETGEWIIYVADERGFNNPQGVWAAQPLDLAIVGDSGTQGYCVPADQHWVALVRRRIAATLNLGMAGNGPLLMLASLVEYLPSLKPRHVVWVYTEGNDMSNLEEEKRSQLLMRYLEPGFRQGLAEHQESIDTMLGARVDRGLASSEGGVSPLSREQGTLADFLRLTSSRRALNLSYGYRLWGDSALFRKILTTARNRVAAWGGKLYFAYLPSRYQEGLLNDTAAVQREIVTIASDLNLPVIDIRRVISKYPAAQQSALQGQRPSDRHMANFGLQAGGHYSVEGNRLVAEAVLSALPLGLR